MSLTQQCSIEKKCKLFNIWQESKATERKHKVHGLFGWTHLNSPIKHQVFDGSVSTSLVSTRVPNCSEAEASEIPAGPSTASVVRRRRLTFIHWIPWFCSCCLMLLIFFYYSLAKRPYSEDDVWFLLGFWKANPSNSIPWTGIHFLSPQTKSVGLLTDHMLNNCLFIWRWNHLILLHPNSKLKGHTSWSSLDLGGLLMLTSGFLHLTQNGLLFTGCLACWLAIQRQLTGCRLTMPFSFLVREITTRKGTRKTDSFAPQSAVSRNIQHSI